MSSVVVWLNSTWSLSRLKQNCIIDNHSYTCGIVANVWLNVVSEGTSWYLILWSKEVDISISKKTSSEKRE